MTVPRAIQILQALLFGNADCRCGNFEINDETREAIKLRIEKVNED